MDPGHLFFLSLVFTGMYVYEFIISFWGYSYSRLQKSCNMQAEKWKTTIDLLCLNREIGHAEAGKIIRFICGK